MAATVRSGGWVPGSLVQVFRGGGDQTRYERRCLVAGEEADADGWVEWEVPAGPGELYARSAGPDGRRVRTLYVKGA